jgi:hypothetical protein
MPLTYYGVAIGTLIGFSRDPKDQYGRWYHGHVDIATPSGTWTSALDVDTPYGLGVRYRTSSESSTAGLGVVGTLPSGFHLLAADSASGAIDYLRSPFLQNVIIVFRRLALLGLPRRIQPLPPPLAPGLPPIPQTKPPIPDSLVEAMLRFLQRVSFSNGPHIRLAVRPWLLSNGDNALTALEAELTGQRKVYLFGEPYTSGQGVHDSHQNQGDPAGSQWWSTDGIWQDGAVAVERPDGSLFFWQVKFDSQASSTDNNGHPL